MTTEPLNPILLRYISLPPTLLYADRVAGAFVWLVGVLTFIALMAFKITPSHVVGITGVTVVLLHCYMVYQTLVDPDFFKNWLELMELMFFKRANRMNCLNNHYYA